MKESTHRIFREMNLQEQFDKEGYVLVKLSSTETLTSLKKTIQNWTEDVGEEFYYSLFSQSRRNLEIQQFVKQELKQHLAEIFMDAKVRNESFLVKPAKHNQEMYLHQDWSFTNSSFYTATFWAPLQGVSENNGSLMVLPGSHNWFDNKVSNSYPSLRVPSNQFNDTEYKSLSLSFGEVVIFNPRLFHGSFPNHSDSNRLVVTCNVFPKKAPYLYYHKVDESTAGEMEMSDDFLLKHIHEMVQPSYNPNIDQLRLFPYNHTPLSEKELKENLGPIV